jgi:hypothetical protein
MLLIARRCTVGILRPNSSILPPADNVQKIRWRQRVLRNAYLPEYRSRHTLGIAAIVNREPIGISKLPGPTLKDLYAMRMERADLRSSRCRLTPADSLGQLQLPRNPLLHLHGSFVGEGHRKDPIRSGPVLY